MVLRVDSFIMDNHQYLLTKDDPVDIRRTQLESFKERSLLRAAQLEAEHKRAIAQLEEKHSQDLRTLNLQVVNWNGHFNALLPIARLPPEILAEIFMIFVNWNNSTLQYDEAIPFSYQNDRPTGGPDATYHPWRTLKHVCKRWQDVVLQTPALFTHICPEDYWLVDFEIEQSRTLPLDIFWYSKIHERRLDRILLELPRIRSMSLSLSHEVLAAACFSGTGSLDAPQLTSLDYFIHLPQSCHTVRLSELNAPELTSLTTRGGSLELIKTFARPTLTSLHMSNWSQENWHLMTEILGLLPALRVLSLRSNKDWSHSDARASHITLPNLVSLIPYDQYNSDGIAHLLEHITCPLLETLKCWSDILLRGSTDPDNELTRAFKTKMNGTVLSTTFLPQTIALLDWECTLDSPTDDPESLFVAVGVWESAYDMDMLEIGPEAWVPEQGSFLIPRMPTLEHIFTQVLPIFNLSHVTNMWLDCHINYTPSVCREFFLSTPNVHILRIDYYRLEEVLTETGQPGPVILPMLKIPV